MSGDTNNPRVSVGLRRIRRIQATGEAPGPFIRALVDEELDRRERERLGLGTSGPAHGGRREPPDLKELRAALAKAPVPDMSRFEKLSSLGPAAPPKPAFLYIAGVPEAYDLDDLRESAEAAGFDIAFEVLGPDEDWGKLRTVLTKAKVAGPKTILVPSLESLDLEPEALLPALKRWTADGFRIVALDQPDNDLADPSYIAGMAGEIQLRAAEERRARLGGRP